MQILKKQFLIKRYPLSLTHSILLTLLTMVIVVLITVYTFLYFQGFAFVDEVSRGILSAKRTAIEEAIRSDIDVPIQSNAIIVHTIGREEGATIAVRDLISDMANSVTNVFTEKQSLSTVEFGGVNGDLVQVIHDKRRPDSDALVLKDAQTQHKLTVYSHLSADAAVKKIIDNDHLLQHAWFTSAASGQNAGWTTAFRDDDDPQNMAVAFSSPAFNRAGKFVGVVASELYLNQLNHSLESLKPFPGSILLIVNEQHQAIASSLPALSPAIRTQKARSALTLQSLEASGIPAIVAADKAIKGAPRPGLQSIEVEGETYYVDAFPIRDRESRLKWQGIIISPTKAIAHTVVKYLMMTMGVLLLILILGLLMVCLVLSRVVKPLQDIVRKADQLATHRWTPPNNKRHFPEIVSLETTFMALSYKLAESFESQRRKIEEDEATGLLTRAGLLQHDSLYSRRNLLGLVHISNMNTIINSLGAEYGNTFINEFIRRLRARLPTDTLLARDKDDKLIIVFPGINQQKDYHRYRELISSLFICDGLDQHPSGKRYVYTGNAGMVFGELTGQNITRLLQEAWLTLKQTQKQGNGVVSLFSSAMRDQELSTLRLHEQLSDAIQRQEFHLVLQPIIDQGDEARCNEGECLIRWHSSTLGDVPPDRFIPLAEETGLIIPLGKWIIEEACRELAQMIARGAPETFVIYINVSAIQLLQQDFAWHLMDSIRRNGLSNDNVCIEITERVLVNHVQRIGKMLSYLRRHGISVSLDDFGANFSSLSCLHSLPFDSIKIDQRFVNGYLDDEKAKSVMDSLIVLARGFNVPLIAEGIEDEAVKRQLKQLGCQKAQGYYFHRPAEFASFRCETGAFYYQNEEGNDGAKEEKCA
ncbi:TPA: EAL domain-containing protein [Raoultella planticola]|nr:EAL domain-containing protein [Raoultella planticola]